MKRISSSLVIGLAFAVFCHPGSSHAGGLYLSSFGDPNMGTASAGAVAIASDASTAHTNPAGMTRLEDHAILAGLAPGFSTVHFENDQQTPSGGSEGGDQGGLVPILSASYVHKLSDDIGVGMSILSLSGAGLNPSKNWSGRFEMTKIKLTTLTFMPAIGFRVTDWLSIGAAALVTYGKLDMDVRAQVGAEPTVRLDDLNDWAGTGMVSVLIEPTPELRFGVLYQGETEFNLKGDVRTPVPAPDFALDLELPLARALRSSVYWDASDRIALVMSSGWEDWSEAGSLPVSTRRGGANVPLNFRDTWYIGLGGYYQLNDRWTLQTGFRYDSSALKDKDRTVALPADRIWTFGVGGLYDFSEKLKIGLGFSWANLGSAPVNNPTVKGKYDRNELFLFNVSFNWKKLPWSGRGTF